MKVQCVSIPEIRFVSEDFPPEVHITSVDSDVDKLRSQTMEELKPFRERMKNIWKVALLLLMKHKVTHSRELLSIAMIPRSIPYSAPWE